MDDEQCQELNEMIEKVSKNTHYVATEVGGVCDVLKEISSYLERIAIVLESR